MEKVEFEPRISELLFQETRMTLVNCTIGAAFLWKNSNLHHEKISHSGKLDMSLRIPQMIKFLASASN